MVNMKKTSKKRRKKLEVPIEGAMPCKKKEQRSTLGFGKLMRSDASNKIQRQSMHASWRPVESHESTWQRVEPFLPKDHEDHIAGKGYNSVAHTIWYTTSIPMPQAMKIPDAKAAVDKEWKKLDTIPAWQLEKVKSKQEVILEAKRDRKQSPLCYIDGPLSYQHCGVKTTISDIVKDDSGASAVFAEQGRLRLK